MLSKHNVTSTSYLKTQPKLQNSLVQNVLETTFGFVGKVVSEKSSTESL